MLGLGEEMRQRSGKVLGLLAKNSGAVGRVVHGALHGVTAPGATCVSTVSIA